MHSSSRNVFSLTFSRNYAWVQSDVNSLAAGITGRVYRGFNTETGDEVAVKAFDGFSGDPNYQKHRESKIKREFEVLRKVDHENVVKLIALEETLNYSKTKVLIMELCNGSSLLDLMQNPTNRNGLPETEFLLVLDHVTKGMKHLRDNNLVHRDLKPGNIMRHITDSGRTVYKLVDFDTARELDEGQEFTSIAGTPGYVHSQVFAKMFNEIDAVKANVDLWSIGATLYHLATGELPFQTNLTGKSKSKAIYELTRLKPSGAIAGKYLSGQPTQWSRDLPKTCPFSNDFKEIIAHLIAALMEADITKEWTYDQFFKETEAILKMRVIHVFYFNNLETIEIWMSPDDDLDQFKERLVKKLSVPKEEQILLRDNQHLETRVASNDKVVALPETSMEHPLFLFSENAINKELPIYSHTRGLSKMMPVPQDNSVDKAVDFARTAYIWSYDYKDIIDKYAMLSELAVEAVQQYSLTLKSKVQKFQKKTGDFKTSLGTILHFADLAKLVGTRDKLSSVIMDLNRLKNDFRHITLYSADLFEKCVQEDCLRKSWQDLMQKSSRDFDAKGVRTSCLSFIRELKKDFDYFSSASKNPTEQEAQFHTLVKKKILSTQQRIFSLLFEEVEPTVKDRSQCLDDWYCMALSIQSKVIVLNEKTNEFEQRLRAISAELFDLKSHLKSEAKKDKTKMTDDLKALIMQSSHTELDSNLAEGTNLIAALEERLLL